MYEKLEVDEKMIKMKNITNKLNKLHNLNSICWNVDLIQNDTLIHLIEENKDHSSVRDLENVMWKAGDKVSLSGLIVKKWAIIERYILIRNKSTKEVQVKFYIL